MAVVANDSYPPIQNQRPGINFQYWINQTPVAISIEGDRFLLAAARALDPNEAVGENPALQEVPKLILYVTRQRCLCGHREFEKRLQMLGKHIVEQLLFRLPTLVSTSIVLEGEFHRPHIGRLDVKVCTSTPNEATVPSVVQNFVFLSHGRDVCNSCIYLNPCFCTIYFLARVLLCSLVTVCRFPRRQGRRDRKYTENH